MNIQTEFINPPIPVRKFDWTAIDVDSYDEETGEPTGYGQTEEAAIAHLMGKLGATCEDVAYELAGRGFSDAQIAKVMNEGVCMKVYQAINAVQGELAKIGIAKDGHNSQGAGYKFRGIDAVYNTIAPLLSKHGLCILPRVLTRQVDERQSKNGGALFYVTVEVEFDFVASEDGSKHTVKTFGEAMDSGDKATNKAMSAAYKYAAFQAFSIPTEGDNDADAHTHEVATKKVQAIKQPALGGIGDDLTPKQRDHLQSLAAWITDNADDPQIVSEELKVQSLDETQLLFVQSFLSPTVRKALGMTYKKAA
jgi:hypothetical protein